MFIKSPFINYTKILDNNYNCYVLLKKTDIDIPKEFYKTNIPIKIFYKISKELFIFQVSHRILENIIHKNNAIIINKKDLIRYNIYNYKLDKFNIIIPILNKSFINILSYLIQFINIYSINNLYKLDKTYNDFKQKKEYLLTIINNLDSNNIWNNNITYEYINNIKEINITKCEFNNLFQSIKEYQEILFCNMLVSIEACHLVINNKDILFKMNKFINNNMLLIKYLQSYTWIILYSRECNNINNVNINSNYIFNINTASLLPKFPILHNNIKYNPYIPLLYSDSILDYTTNYSGITLNKNTIVGYGISDIIEFIYRLNIFCTGNPYINIFKNLTNFGICGDAISACIPLFHPLMYNIKNNNNCLIQHFIDYFDEYYYNSTIDIMLEINNEDEMYNKVKNFYNELKIRYNDIILNYEKNITFYNTPVIYNDYIIPNNIINNYICKFKSINDGNKLYIDYKYTYTIISKSLKYNIKIYNIKDTYMKHVSQYKLANLRAYYDGNNVYLTPSCISAYMTFMNLNHEKINKLDYDLYNKYRMRGYGTWLYNNDINYILEYSLNSYLWKNLFNNKTFIGIQNINYKLYYPRLYNSDMYHEDIDLMNRYNIDLDNNILYTYIINSLYPHKNNSLINYNNLSAINNLGKILPFNKWIINACIDI
jgi:hypothetical protein